MWTVLKENAAIFNKSQYSKLFLTKDFFQIIKFCFMYLFSVATKHCQFTPQIFLYQTIQPKKAITCKPFKVIQLLHDLSTYVLVYNQSVLQTYKHSLTACKIGNYLQMKTKWHKGKRVERPEWMKTSTQKNLNFLLIFIILHSILSFEIINLKVTESGFSQ